MKRVKRLKVWSTKKADDEFSKWIRARDKKCISCGRTTNLTCSHFWRRVNSSVRYDPENCDTLCWMPCHITWEKEKQGKYMAFKLKQLGQEKYSFLMLKAHKIVKRDEAILELMKWLKPPVPELSTGGTCATL